MITQFKLRSLLPPLKPRGLVSLQNIVQRDGSASVVVEYWREAWKSSALFHSIEAETLYLTISVHASHQDSLLDVRYLACRSVEFLVNEMFAVQLDPTLGKKY